jgi:hypothetical protein
MKTATKSRRRRWVARSVAFAVAAALLALAWHFAGYEPSCVISRPGLHPLTVQDDGAVLIAGGLPTPRGGSG